MSRLENKSLYVPIGGELHKSGFRRFCDKHRLPPVREMLFASLAAVALFIVVLLLLMATGLRLTSVSRNTGEVYHYFGWIIDGKPMSGLLHCPDGRTASVKGGVIHYSDGSSYTGQNTDFMRHGQGVTAFADGSTYAGSYLNDKPDGIGKFTAKDGMSYDGEWSGGLYNGSGVLILADGTKYTGNFVDGEKSGEGTIEYYNGDTFTGIFANDMRVSGTYRWATGDSITVELFENNLPPTDEKVIYTSAFGDTCKAYYKAGSLSGKTSYTPPVPQDPDDNDDEHSGQPAG